MIGALKVARRWRMQTSVVIANSGRSFSRSPQASGYWGFRRSIRSRVGMFFVRKSSPGQIRLVIDARVPNRCHRVPPYVSLGSAAALSEQSLSAEALQFP